MPTTTTTATPATSSASMMAPDGGAVGMSSLRIRILGMASSTALYAAVVAANVAIMLGMCWYPIGFGLGVLLPYLTYTSNWRRDEFHRGAPWPSFSRHFVLFQNLRNYLSLRLVAHPELKRKTLRQTSQFTEDESVSQIPQYIFAVFPHGTHADYWILLDGLLSDVVPDEVARRTRTLAASILIRIPLLREIALWTGCVDARRSVAEQLLISGHSLLLLPGGQEEQLRTMCGEERVYVQRRRGFVKLALQHDVPVVPVYVFGASDHYQTSSLALPFRRWLLRSTGIAWPFTSGALVPLPRRSYSGHRCDW